MKDDKMGKALSMHGGDQKCMQNLLVERLERKNSLERSMYEGRIVLKWTIKE
jgi:hypothetical protein